MEKSKSTTIHLRAPSNDKLAALLFPTSSVSSRKGSFQKESSSGYDSIMSAHPKPILVTNTLSSEQIEKMEHLHCYDSGSSEQGSFKIMEGDFESKQVKGVANVFKLN